MHCKTVKKLMEAYIEGELDEPRSKAIESHIANCQICANELALTQKVHKAVDCLSTPPVPGDIISNTLNLIHQRSVSRWLWLRKWPVVVSAMILLGLILFGIGYQRFNTKPDLTEEQIIEASEGLNLALGIVAAGTQYAQNTAIAEGARTYDLVKVASVSTLQEISKVQIEVSEKIKANLGFLSQLNFDEVKNNEEF